MVDSTMAVINENRGGLNEGKVKQHVQSML